MKKRHVTRLIFGSILLLLVLAVPAIAAPPQEAEGLWRYQPFILEVREDGCNTYLKTFENAVWTGTFDGNSTEDGRVWIRCNGAWDFKSVVTFEQVTVDGKTGALKMLAYGSRPDGNADWFGYWEIKRGTGELANLQGQGTWEGPGAPGPGEWGDIFYYGEISFDPD